MYPKVKICATFNCTNEIPSHSTYCKDCRLIRDKASRERYRQTEKGRAATKRKTSQERKLHVDIAVHEFKPFNGDDGTIEFWLKMLSNGAPKGEFIPLDSARGMARSGAGWLCR